MNAHILIRPNIMKDQDPVDAINKNDRLILLRGLSAEKADLILLILTSQHIDAWAQKKEIKYELVINAQDKQKAHAMVKAYYLENRLFGIRHAASNFTSSPFKSITVFLIMGLLAAVYFFSISFDQKETMIHAYGASSLYILRGEDFRAITALFIHDDLGHLLGNLSGLLIFGSPLIHVTGFGTGPLMLLCTGATGNLMNALIFRTARLSIGASTSVMGAAGLLVAFQITRNGKISRSQLILPLIAGALLVGFLSQGERTDVSAHIFGFLSGLCQGLPFFPLNRTVRFRQKEPLALLITLVIVISSVWSYGLG